MGNPYRITTEKIKRYLREKYPDIKLVEEDGLLYFDVGFGENFAVFVLPVEPEFSTNSLLDFTSVEVFLESVRRFIEVKPPKGYRVRFIAFNNVDKECLSLKEHISSIGADRILIIVNIKELGIGNEKVVINGLSGKIIFKISKVLKENGLNTGLIRDKGDLMSKKFVGLNVLEFRSFPNPYKGMLSKEFYDERRRNFGVTLGILIVSSVFRL